MSDPKFRSVEQMLATIRQIMGEEEPDTPSAKVVRRTSNALDDPRRVEPQLGGDRTFEVIIRDLLEPMLRAWLDQNLRSLVEREVRAEIARRMPELAGREGASSARTSARRQRSSRT